MRLMKLRHVADIRNSNVDKVVVDGEQPIRLCNYVDVYKNDFIEADMKFSAGSATKAEIKAFGLREGDVIITKDSEDRNDIGVPALVRSTAPDLVCGYHLSLLRAKKGVAIGPFLFWALLSKSARDAFSNAAYGITRFGMTLGGMKNVAIPLPDLATQRRIADFLDRETARIDRAIEKKQRLVELLGEKLAATVTFTLTNGLNPAAKRKASGVSWIGEVPAHWSITKLGHIGQSANGINIGGDAFGSGFPFVSYGDVYRNPELPRAVAGLVQSSAEDRARYTLKKGDILFTRTSEIIEEIGFSSVCMEDMPDTVFAGFLIRFRPVKGVLLPLFSKFLFRNERLRAFFNKEMMIVTRASLSQGLLKRLPIVLPPIEEQREIAQYLQRLEGTFVSASEKARATINLLKEYRAALVTAAVTGQIDVEAYAKSGTTERRLDAIEQEAGA